MGQENSILHQNKKMIFWQQMCHFHSCEDNCYQNCKVIITKILRWNYHLAMDEKWPNYRGMAARYWMSHQYPLAFYFWWVETFKVKVYLAVSRHFPAQPFCPILVLTFAWKLFSSLHLRLAPFLGSLIVLQFHNLLSEFWESTVLDSAKPFGRIRFFCYIALSILSPRVRLKERVVA